MIGMQRYSPEMPDLERLRAAAREWLAHIGDLDNSPVVVPFGDPEGAEQKARYDLARVLRDELFKPVRRGPLYVWSGEGPLDGQRQHWGGSDIWKCDEHPDWQGEEYGTWESYRDIVASDERREWRDDQPSRTSGRPNRSRRTRLFMEWRSARRVVLPGAP